MDVARGLAEQVKSFSGDCGDFKRNRSNCAHLRHTRSHRCASNNFSRNFPGELLVILGSCATLRINGLSFACKALGRIGA